MDNHMDLAGISLVGYVRNLEIGSVGEWLAVSEQENAIPNGLQKAAVNKPINGEEQAYTIYLSWTTATTTILPLRKFSE